MVTYDVIYLRDQTHNILNTSPKFYLDFWFGHLLGDGTKGSFLI